ncbi:thyroid transcription factor 1-associated protein 26 [Elysia marginata]|uniref:Thyroid transcription factor 1-associated protein 26 n=1 Tax=Elysia marginata TaxID=1093978 RepID=A0AAV4J5W5_9GAST|nr:thyroid transcription factor 1-associated protein 26 [Elysia marginata]
MGKTKTSKAGKDSYKSFLGNKKEGQGFADKRKKKAAYDYLKLLKKEKNSAAHSGDTDAPKHRPLDFLRSQIKSPHQGKKKHAFSVAEKIAKKKQEEKQGKKRKALQVKRDREAALKDYKDKKQKQHLKLCKRTSRGQPVMRHQMELLLDKIHRQKGGGSSSS